MKNISLLCLLMLFHVLNIQAQHKIAFDSSLTTAIEKAKQQNKLVFVDCQTKWCGACRMVEKEVFTLDTVADFFREHFVSASIDMEKGDGIQDRKKYKVAAFPTFLILTSEGKELYRFVGAWPPNLYMGQVRNGIDPQSAVRQAITAYNAGDRSKATLREYIQYSMHAFEDSIAKVLAARYYKMLSHTERLQPENWFLFDKEDGTRLFGLYGEQFNYVAGHWNEFERYNGKEKVETRLRFNYKAIVARTITSIYREHRAYNKKEFDLYRQQIPKTELTDKEQLVAMIEIAQAAGAKDTVQVSKLMVRYIPGFSAEQQSSMMFYYKSMLENKKDYQKLPYFTQVVDAIIKSNKDERLVKEMMEYKQSS